MSIWTFRILWFMCSHSVTKQSRLQGAACSQHKLLTTELHVDKQKIRKVFVTFKVRIQKGCTTVVKITYRTVREVLRWKRHAERNGANKYAYRNLDGGPEGKGMLSRYSCRRDGKSNLEACHPRCVL